MQVEICASTLRDVAVAMEVGADRVGAVQRVDGWRTHPQRRACSIRRGHGHACPGLGSAA